MIAMFEAIAGAFRSLFSLRMLWLMIWPVMVAITLWAGVSGGAKVEASETFQPFETRAVSFDLTVPQGQGDPTLFVTANPALYAARREHEAQRPLPPGVTEVPARLPAEWGPGGAITVGEVWALDNTRSLTLPRTARNDCLIANLETPGTVLGDQFNFRVHLYFLSHLKAESGGQLTVTATPVGGGAPTTLSAPVTLAANATKPSTVPGQFTSVPPGSYQVVAELFCSDDSHPANNRREATVTVQAIQTTEGDGNGSSLTD